MTAAPSLLLVEDSTFFLTIEKQFLRNTPVAVQEARDAEQAFARCRERRPSLIYMAYDLRGTSGADCCRRLKADPDLRAIPVILICDEKRPDHLERCRQAGSDGVLTKPLDRRRFLELGRSFLAGIREPRRPCLIRVRFRMRGKELPGRGLDLSSGGFFLESTEPVEPGEPLQLELHLSRSGEQGPRLACGGVVAWLNTRENPLRPNHPVGAGVKFTDLAAPAAAVLNGFLKSLDAG